MILKKKIENNYMHIENLSSKKVEVELNLDGEICYFEIMNSVNNISLFRINNVELVCDEELQVEFSDKKKYDMELDAYNKQRNVKMELVNEIEIFYSERGNLKNPRKMIVIFPSMSRAKAIKYEITSFTSLSEKVTDNCVIISLQDYFDAYGLYLFADDKGKNMFPGVTKFLRNKIKEYNVSEENVTFFGASKGGLSAILYAEFFPKVELVVSAPNLILEKFFQTSKDMGTYYPNIFRRLNIDYKKMRGDKVLKKLIDRGQKVNYIQGLRDYGSNSAQSFCRLEKQNYTLLCAPTGHAVTVESAQYLNYVLSNIIYAYNEIINDQIIYSLGEFKIPQELMGKFQEAYVSYLENGNELLRLKMDFNDGDSCFLNPEFKNYLPVKSNQLRLSLINNNQQMVINSRIFEEKSQFKIKVHSIIFLKQCISIQIEINHKIKITDTLEVELYNKNELVDSIPIFPYKRKEYSTSLSTKNMDFHFNTQYSNLDSLNLKFNLNGEICSINDGDEIKIEKYIDYYEE